MKKYVTLGEVCKLNMGQSPDSSTYNDNGEGIPFYQGNADFGEIHPITAHWCTSPTKLAEDGDILISVRAPIGALNIATEKCCIGRGLAAITVDSENVIRDYIWYMLKSRVTMLQAMGTGSTFKAINKNVLNDMQFLMPTLEEQNQIALNLIKIDTVIHICTDLMNKLDMIVKSRFIELFGDPVSNPMKWDIKPLLSIGKCKNGMNFHYDDSGVEIHCLGVGDFKDLSIITDTTILPKISLNEIPSDEYLLQNGDIVFVRSNGNKALVGRSLAIYPNGTPTTFSGFCIRFRKSDNSIIVPYLIRVLKTDSMRKKMAGRGANIQNLNQQILSSLEIPIPPFDLQKQFADFVEQTDKSKFIVDNIKKIIRRVRIYDQL